MTALLSAAVFGDRVQARQVDIKLSKLQELRGSMTWIIGANVKLFSGDCSFFFKLVIICSKPSIFVLRLV